MKNRDQWSDEAHSIFIKMFSEGASYRDISLSIYKQTGLIFDNTQIGSRRAQFNLEIQKDKFISKKGQTYRTQYFEKTPEPMKEYIDEKGRTIKVYPSQAAKNSRISHYDDLIT